MAVGGNIKGITIKFEGDTTELGKAMKKINAEAKGVDKALKDVNKALKFEPKNTELLAQKQTLLKQKVQQTKNQLDALKRAEETMNANGVDKNSQEFMELRREIIQTESKLKHFEKEAQKLNNVKLTALGNQFKDVGSKMQSVGKGMTQYVTVPIVAGFTVAGKAASDYEENLNKLDVAFGSNSESVKKFTDNALETYGLSKVAASDAAASFGALAKGIGLTDDEAAQTATTLTGLSADLASYFNTGTDESAKALEGIFTGESEALKKFGVVMNDTNLEQFAADQGKVWSEMDQTEKTMLRYEYVLSKTGDAQGDYSRTNEGTANSFKTLKGALEDLATAIGTQLLPIITPIVQKITDLITKFTNLPEPVQKVITIVGLIAAATGPLVMVIGGIITALGNLMIFGPIIFGMLGPFIPLIIGIIAAIVAVIAIITHWSQIVEWFKGVWERAMAVIQAVWAQVSQYLQIAWEALKTAAQIVWNAIKTAITAPIQLAWTIIQTVWNAVKTFLINAWNNIKNTAASVWNAVKEKIITPIQNAWERLKGIVDGIKQKLSDTWESIKSTAKSVWEGIKSAITEPIETAKELVSTAVEKIKGFFPLSIGKIFSNLKLPHFSVSGGEAPWGFGGKGSLPHVSVDWYAKGGIFDSPSIIGIGEAGSEAVVPLDKFWSKMDKIADAISGGGDQIQIIVNAAPGMDVTQLANEVERKLIQAQKRRTQAWQ